MYYRLKKKNYHKLRWITTILFLLIPVSISLYDHDQHLERMAQLEAERQLFIKQQKELEWNLFIEAVIWRESEGKETAIGDSGKAVGVLQIWPIMVDEANRIQDSLKFAYNDRYSREKSIEMFKVVQSHYNPNRNYSKALNIWNPHHPNEYRDTIFRKFDELKKENGIV